MAKILLYWGWEADLIECPLYIVQKLSIYQRQFDKWLSNPDTKHDCWIKDSEGEMVLGFDVDAFLEWINKVVLSDKKERAYFIKRDLCLMRNK